MNLVQEIELRHKLEVSKQRHFDHEEVDHRGVWISAEEAEHFLHLMRECEELKANIVELTEELHNAV
jgi:hypothetical protein